MISLLCPSRGRPKFAKRLIDSALSTTSTPLEFLFYLNDDDEFLNEYKKLLHPTQYIIGPDRSPVYSWNNLAEQCNGDIYFLTADHVQFIKNDWDIAVYDKFKMYTDNILFVYFSVTHHLDHTGVNYSPEWHCPFYFVHKDWVKELGYFACPAFWHWFPDLFFYHIAKKINRIEIIKEPSISFLSVKTDSTDAKKHYLCNRERDLWMWNKVKRWIDADATHLLNYINSKSDICNND